MNHLLTVPRFPATPLRVIAGFLLMVAVVLAAVSAAFASGAAPLEVNWVSGCHPPLTPADPKRAFGCAPEGGETITIRGRNFGRAGAKASLVFPRPIMPPPVSSATDNDNKNNKNKNKKQQNPLSDDQQQQQQQQQTRPSPAEEYPIADQKSDIIIDCTSTRHSDQLPTILLFCTLPEILDKVTLEHIKKAAKERFNEDATERDRTMRRVSYTLSNPGDKNMQIVRYALLRNGAATFHVLVTLPNNAQQQQQQQSPSSFSSSSALIRNAVTYLSGGDGASPEQTLRQQKALSSLVSMDWKQLGVGGLNKEVKQLIRRVIATRSSKQAVQMMGDLGVSHVKGVLLHGAPGTGKTMLARKISDFLGAAHVSVVNGPSLVSKFVGESEKNLRELFGPAEADWKRFGASSPLHVIILDEVDAIMKTRHSNEETSSGATAIYDGLTTQMLAAMDGLESVGNVLVFALTNRKDALDAALLRPGRFEVQLHLSLPNVKARKEIFEIHSDKLEKARMLAHDVDFAELADLTPTFSGADIMGVVRSAVSYAVHRMGEALAKEMDGGDASSAATGPPSSSEKTCSGDGACRGGGDFSASATSQAGGDEKKKNQVHMSDFIAAIGEVRAIKGSAAVDTPSRLLRRGMVATAAHGPVLSRLRANVRDLVRLPRKSFFRVLLHGAPESGLTSVAASVCQMHSFDSVQVIRSESLSNLASDKVADTLNKAVSAARDAKNACLVIDGADQLAAAGEYIKAGVASSLNTGVLKALRQALTPAGEHVLGDEEYASAASKSKKDNDATSTSAASTAAAATDDDEDDDSKAGAGRVMLVLTVQSLSFVRSLGGSNGLFDTEEHISLLGTDDIARVLVGYGLYAKDETRQAKVAASKFIASDIPVKRLLRAIDVVRSKTAPASALPCRSTAAESSSSATSSSSSSSSSSTADAAADKEKAIKRQEERDGTVRLPTCEPIPSMAADVLREAAASFHIDA